MKNKFYLLIIIACSAILAFKSDTKKKYPCPNTSCMDSLSNVNEKPYLKDSIIVIYTFLACRPCQVLAKKMQKKYNEPKYLDRIVFINNVDFDGVKVKDYLKTNEIGFPYLMTPYPDFQEISYPLICFYGKNGELISTIEGYGRPALVAIKNFLR